MRIKSIDISAKLDKEAKKADKLRRHQEELTCYKGKIVVGDVVKIRFAGESIVGTVIEIEMPDRQETKDFEDEFGPVNTRTFYIVSDGKYKYPVTKERIREKKN